MIDTHGKGWCKAWALLGLVVLIAVPVLAHLPEPDPVARAASKQHRTAQRAQILALDVTIRRLVDEQVLAKGVLLSSPAGRARLTMQHRQGFVERQLRRSAGLSASRAGVLLEQPHPILPPLWVLQAASGSRLLTQLAELGGDTSQVAMGYDGEHDCYLLGGREGVSFWVDQATLEIVRIDVSDGVQYRMGPLRSFEGEIRFPEWIEVEAPALSPLRLEIDHIQRKEDAPEFFRPQWLTEVEG